jgi:hypothetical protein
MTSESEFTSLPYGEALEYTLLCLGSGLTLSRSLEARIKHVGAVATGLPMGVASDGKVHFREGRRLPRMATPSRCGGNTVATPNTDDCLVAHVAHSLGSTPGRIFLVENALARRGDTSVRHFRSRLLFHAEEVYHAVWGSEANEHDIRLALTDGRSVLEFVAVLSSLPEGTEFVSDQISQARIARLAACADEVIVGAYDGESFILWTLSAPEPESV